MVIARERACFIRASVRSGLDSRREGIDSGIKMRPTRLNPSMVAAYTAAGFWEEETIYRFAAQHARTIPGAFVVRDRYRRMTYAALVDAADRLAASLAGHGITSGDGVAVWLPRRVETAVALLVCSRNGYVCCPSLHRDHSVGEILAGR